MTILVASDFGCMMLTTLVVPLVRGGLSIAFMNMNPFCNELDFTILI